METDPSLQVVVRGLPCSVSTVELAGFLSGAILAATGFDPKLYSDGDHRVCLACKFLPTDAAAELVFITPLAATVAVCLDGLDCRGAKLCIQRPANFHADGEDPVWTIEAQLGRLEMAALLGFTSTADKAGRWYASSWRASANADCPLATAGSHSSWLNEFSEPSHYEVLSVRSNATSDQIRKAYADRTRELRAALQRRLPNGDRMIEQDENMQQQLWEALQTLSSAKRRRAYDRRRMVWEAAEGCFRHDPRAAAFLVKHVASLSFPGIRRWRLDHRLATSINQTLPQLRARSGADLLLLPNQITRSGALLPVAEVLVAGDTADRVNLALQLLKDAVLEADGTRVPPDGVVVFVPAEALANGELPLSQSQLEQIGLETRTLVVSFANRVVVRGEKVPCAVTRIQQDIQWQGRVRVANTVEYDAWSYAMLAERQSGGCMAQLAPKAEPDIAAIRQVFQVAQEAEGLKSEPQAETLSKLGARVLETFASGQHTPSQTLLLVSTSIAMYTEIRQDPQHHQVLYVASLFALWFNLKICLPLGRFVEHPVWAGLRELQLLLWDDIGLAMRRKACEILKEASGGNWRSWSQALAPSSRLSYFMVELFTWMSQIRPNLSIPPTQLATVPAMVALTTSFCAGAACRTDPQKGILWVQMEPEQQQPRASAVHHRRVDGSMRPRSPSRPLSSSSSPPRFPPAGRAAARGSLRKQPLTVDEAVASLAGSSRPTSPPRLRPRQIADVAATFTQAGVRDKDVLTRLFAAAERQAQLGAEWAETELFTVLQSALELDVTSASHGFLKSLQGWGSLSRHAAAAPVKYLPTLFHTALQVHNPSLLLGIAKRADRASLSGVAWARLVKLTEEWPTAPEWAGLVDLRAAVLAAAVEGLRRAEVAGPVELQLGTWRKLVNSAAEHTKEPLTNLSELAKSAALRTSMSSLELKQSRSEMVPILRVFTKFNIQCLRVQACAALQLLHQIVKLDLQETRDVKAILEDLCSSGLLAALPSLVEVIAGLPNLAQVTSLDSFNDVSMGETVALLASQVSMPSAEQKQSALQEDPELASWTSELESVALQVEATSPGSAGWPLTTFEDAVRRSPSCKAFAAAESLLGPSWLQVLLLCSENLFWSGPGKSLGKLDGTVWRRAPCPAVAVGRLCQALAGVRHGLSEGCCSGWPPALIVRCPGSAEIAETVAGTYVADGQHHGRQIYRRSALAGSAQAVLYYWDSNVAPGQQGWWFGPEVGGEEVWLCNDKSPEWRRRPPKCGWQLQSESEGQQKKDVHKLRLIFCEAKVKVDDQDRSAPGGPPGARSKVLPEKVPEAHELQERLETLLQDVDTLLTPVNGGDQSSSSSTLQRRIRALKRKREDRMSACEEELKAWLHSLDGKGAMLQYFDALRAHFDCSLVQVKAARLCKASGSEKGLLGIIDPLFWQAAGIKKTGHQLVFAQAIGKL